QEAMRDAAAEMGRGGIFLVDVHGVIVAGNGGEQDNVGFRDRLGEGRRHAGRQIFYVIAIELVHFSLFLRSSQQAPQSLRGIMARRADLAEWKFLVQKSGRLTPKWKRL